MGFNFNRFCGVRIALLGVCLFGLSACSSISLDKTSSSKSHKTARNSFPPSHFKHEHWEESPQGGGYYLDDGPGELRPANLEDLPSAVPQIEPIAIRNTRQYTVMGQTFDPQTSLEEPYRETGRASWYGRKFHGAKTANGEIYDMYQMTAAHPTLPLPSYAKVTNLANGKSVIVRVNDRGPFLRGRIIDLSYAAAFQLDYIKHGSAEVLVEKMTPEVIAQYHAEKNEGQPALMQGVTVERVALNQSAPAVAVSNSSLYLQIGAFVNRLNAENLIGQVSSNHESFGKASLILSESGLHRVLVGPFFSIDQANDAAIELSAFVQVQPVIKQDLILP
jgi:rare lipoprotein A